MINSLTANREQAAVTIARAAGGRSPAGIPVELRTCKVDGSSGSGGNRSEPLPERLEARELRDDGPRGWLRASSPLKSPENTNGSLASHSSPHEEHRNLSSQKIHRARGPKCGIVRECDQAFAECAVADLDHGFAEMQ